MSIHFTYAPFQHFERPREGARSRRGEQRIQREDKQWSHRRDRQAAKREESLVCQAAHPDLQSYHD